MKEIRIIKTSFNIYEVKKFTSYIHEEPKHTHLMFKVFKKKNMCVCVCVYMYIPIHMHSYIHIYIPTHTQMDVV